MGSGCSLVAAVTVCRHHCHCHHRVLATTFPVSQTKLHGQGGSLRGSGEVLQKYAGCHLANNKIPNLDLCRDPEMPQF